MTLPFELDLYTAKLNQRAKYLSHLVQKLNFTDTQTLAYLTS